MSNVLWDGLTERRDRKAQCGKFICGLSEHELENFMDDIAERGAKKALKSIGLEDEGAVQDVKTLRGILKNWRTGMSAAWAQLGRLVMFLIILFLASFMFKPTSAIVQAIGKAGP